MIIIRLCLVFAGIMVTAQWLPVVAQQHPDILYNTALKSTRTINQFLDQGQYDSAWANIQLLYNAGEKKNNPYLKGVAKGRESFYFYKKGQETEALTAGRACIALFQAADSIFSLARAINNTSTIAASFSNTNEAEYFARMILQYQNYLQINAPRDLYDGLNQLGVYLRNNGKYEESTLYLTQAVQLNSEKNLNDAYALINLGTNYSIKGNYTKAIEYIKKAYAISATNQDTYSVANSALAIAGLFYDSESLDEADRWFQKSLDNCQQHQFTELLPLCYLGIGNVKLKQNKWSDALHNYNNAYDRAEILKDTITLAAVLIMRSTLLKKQHKLEQALTSIQKAYQFAHKTQQYDNEIVALMNESEILINLHQPLVAISLLNQSINIATVQNVKKYTPESYRLLSQAYAQIGDNPNAFKYLSQYQSTKDSIHHLLLINTGKLLSELDNSEIKERLLRTETVLSSEKETNSKSKFITVTSLTLGIILGILALLYAYRFAFIQKKITQQKIETQTEQLRTFNYAIGHDLKTPIDNILHYLMLIQQQTETNNESEISENVQRILQLSHISREMINALLRFSDIDQQPMQTILYNPKPDIEEIVNNHIILNKNRRISYEIGPIPALRADPNLMRVVFTNLINNAIKFTQLQAQAHIKIFYQKNAGYHRLFVQDNGTGVPKEQVEKIFLLFKSAHDRTIFPGTGIGLAIAHRITERHGGFIQYQDTPGAGATFIVNIPK
jgi:signal transduction histidine kinase